MTTAYEAERRRLLEEIAADVRMTRDALGKDVLDPRVMAAIGRVPRHEFVDDEWKDVAYLNQPLPIGRGQTISQPYIVAVMTDFLDVPADGRVLEVGTGCGYQAAVLAEVCESVYSIEIVAPLGHDARDRLARLGYDNVHVRVGDGFAGWPEHGPYDGIIVTAAADEVPPPLLEQLKPGGRMIIPLRTRFGGQELVLIETDDRGSVRREDILPVMFVPLTGDHG
jgi:protein-L-isoaspartate(D-aspartate) O-methyltransferase